jgi:hypothetical protein
MNNTRFSRFVSCTFALWLLSHCCGECFYDPGAQRWLNRDPLDEAGDLNPSRFLLNAPVDLIDPLGLKFQTAQCKVTKLGPVKRGPVQGTVAWPGVPPSQWDWGYIIQRECTVRCYCDFDDPGTEYFQRFKSPPNKPAKTCAAYAKELEGKHDCGPPDPPNCNANSPPAITIKPRS